MAKTDITPKKKSQKSLMNINLRGIKIKMKIINNNKNKNKDIWKRYNAWQAG